MIQKVCEHHEYIQITYTDTAGNFMANMQCRFCGKLWNVSDPPNALGEGSEGKKNINTNELPSNEVVPQVLHKANVIRWVEFEKQLPNDGDEVVIYNPKREQKQIIVWCSGLERNLSKDYTAWYFLPPIV